MLFKRFDVSKYRRKTAPGQMRQAIDALRILLFDQTQQLEPPRGQEIPRRFKTGEIGPNLRFIRKIFLRGPLPSS